MGTGRAALVVRAVRDRPVDDGGLVPQAVIPAPYAPTSFAVDSDAWCSVRQLEQPDAEHPKFRVVHAVNCGDHARATRLARRPASWHSQAQGPFPETGLHTRVNPDTAGHVAGTPSSPYFAIFLRLRCLRRYAAEPVATSRRCPPGLQTQQVTGILARQPAGMPGTSSGTVPRGPDREEMRLPARAVGKMPALLDGALVGGRQAARAVIQAELPGRRRARQGGRSSQAVHPPRRSPPGPGARANHAAGLRRGHLAACPGTGPAGEHGTRLPLSAARACLPPARPPAAHRGGRRPRRRPGAAARGAAGHGAGGADRAAGHDDRGESQRQNRG